MPVQDSDYELIWTGSRKSLGGFPERFLNEFLDKFYTFQEGLNKRKHLVSRINNGITEYQCFECTQFFPLKRHAAAGQDFLSIDHHLSIREWVLSKVTPHTELIAGHLWTYYLLDECKAAHLSMENLVGMCQKCNSRKGGSQDLDGEMRVHETDRCEKCLKDGSGSSGRFDPM